MARKQSRTSGGKSRRRPSVPAEEDGDNGVSSRAEEMEELRRQKYTFQQIGEEFGLSRQRVQQIVSRNKERQRKNKQKYRNKAKGLPGNSLILGRGAPRKADKYRATAEDPTSMELGDRLAYRRIKIGMTLQQLSKSSGISTGMLSKYETNRTTPSCDTLRKLCISLRVSAHWLVFGRPFKRTE